MLSHCKHRERDRRMREKHDWRVLCPTVLFTLFSVFCPLYPLKKTFRIICYQVNLMLSETSDQHERRRSSLAIVFGGAFSFVVLGYLFCFWYISFPVLNHVPFFCDSKGCSPPRSPFHGISPAGILVWAAISFSRGSPSPRDWTLVSSIAGRLFSAVPAEKTFFQLEECRNPPLHQVESISLSL